MPVLSFNCYDEEVTRGPIDDLSFWTVEDWERAYKLNHLAREPKEMLQSHLDDMKVQVQKQNDLIYHPGAFSGNKNEQNHYWDLYYTWYMQELPSALQALEMSLITFWDSGPVKRFYNSSPDQDVRLLLEKQHCSLLRFWKEFAAQDTDLKRRQLLNPRQRGARIISPSGMAVVIENK